MFLLIDDSVPAACFLSRALEMNNAAGHIGQWCVGAEVGRALLATFLQSS